MYVFFVRFSVTLTCGISRLNTAKLGLSSNWPSSLLVGEMAAEESDSASEKEDIKEFQAKHRESATGTSMSTLGDILRAKLEEKEKK